MMIISGCWHSLWNVGICRLRPGPRQRAAPSAPAAFPTPITTDDPQVAFSWCIFPQPSRSWLVPAVPGLWPVGDAPLAVLLPREEGPETTADPVLLLRSQPGGCFRHHVRGLYLFRADQIQPGPQASPRCNILIEIQDNLFNLLILISVSKTVQRWFCEPRRTHWWEQGEHKVLHHLCGWGLVRKEGRWGAAWLNPWHSCRH